MPPLRPSTPTSSRPAAEMQSPESSPMRFSSSHTVDACEMTRTKTRLCRALPPIGPLDPDEARSPLNSSNPPPTATPHAPRRRLISGHTVDQWIDLDVASEREPSLAAAAFAPSNARCPRPHVVFLSQL